MGATTSVAALEPGEVGAASGGAGTSAKTAELDKYGGKDRPAVKRGESFNKAMGWLGDNVANQADSLANALVDPGSGDMVQSIHIEPDEPSRKTTHPTGASGSTSAESTSKLEMAQKRTANRRTSKDTGKGAVRPTATATRAAKAPAPVKEMPMSDTLAKAVKGHRGWKAKLSTGNERTQVCKKPAVPPSTAPVRGGRTPKSTGKSSTGKSGIMKSGVIQGTKALFSSAGRSNRTERKGGWRHRVHNAKKTAYMTLKVYLKLQANWNNQTPGALGTNIGQVIRTTLHDDFPKFATHNERFFRSASQFAVAAGGLGRATSIRVVDLDEGMVGGFRESTDLGELPSEGRTSSDGADMPGDRDAAMMEMFARKANAQWVERQDWELPKVFELHNYMLSVERTHYNYTAKELLKKGKIAFHFVGSGEAVFTPDGRALDAVATDTWQLLNSCAPNKIPSGCRVEGLSPVSRQIIQLVDTLERVAGAEAVASLQIVISVGEEEEDLVINLLKEHKFYRLEAGQVHIIVQDKQFGFKYEKKYEELLEAEESELMLPGAGHALLQLASPSEAVQWDGTHMGPHNGSMLDHFKEKGVVWLMSIRMLDLHWCANKKQADLDFFGLCLKLHDTTKANMMMEVAPCASMTELSTNNSIIMERAMGNGRPSTTCDVAYTDCRSIGAQEKLSQMMQAEDAMMYTSQRRYFFYLPEFRDQLMERATFRADIRIQKGYAYLNFDFADITSGPLARCAAVVQKPNQLKPPPPSPIVDINWLGSLGPILAKQDQQDGFCQRAIQAQSRIAPVAICRKPFVGEQCVHICLFVSDNEASRKALRLAKALMQNDANFLRIVTVASTQTGIHRAEDMMAYYRELLGIVPSNQLVTEVVVRRHGTTVETLLDYVARERTDLVIMGTEKLSQEHSMGSVALAVLKATTMPVMVVKADILTECTKEDVDKMTRAERRSVKLMLRVEHSSRSALTFAMQMLDARADKLALVRCKGNSQLGLGQMEEKNSDKRLLESFQDAATTQHFGVTALNTNLEPLQALPKLCSENNCDILLLRRSTKGKLSDDIPKYIMKSRAAVLVYQGEDGGASPTAGSSIKSLGANSSKALL